MAVAARGILLMARQGVWVLSNGPPGDTAALKAKLYANRELQGICALAHQCHGAIGFTWEHDLHLFTRHAIGWRSEYGDTRQLTNLLSPRGPPVGCQPGLADKLDTTMTLDCIFCRILVGDLPSAEVYGDDVAYAFADISPVTPDSRTGHTA